MRQLYIITRNKPAFTKLYSLYTFTGTDAVSSYTTTEGPQKS